MVSWDGGRLVSTGGIPGISELNAECLPPELIPTKGGEECRVANSTPGIWASLPLYFPVYRGLRPQFYKINSPKWCMTIYLKTLQEKVSGKEKKSRRGRCPTALPRCSFVNPLQAPWRLAKLLVGSSVLAQLRHIWGNSGRKVIMGGYKLGGVWDSSLS